MTDRLEADDKYITDLGSECYDFIVDGNQFCVLLSTDNTLSLVVYLAHGKSIIFKTDRITGEQNDMPL